MNRHTVKKFNKWLLPLAALSLGLSIAFTAACGPDKIVEEPGNGVPSYETEAEVTGTVSGNPSANGKFYTDYATKQEALEAHRELNIQLAEEGDVLLKNADNALPLSSEETGISLFGYLSANLRTGGGGSGTGKTDIYGIPSTNLKKSLEDNGFEVNPELWDLYEGVRSELGTNYFTPAITESYSEYGDAAIIVIGRGGSEGSDLSATQDSLGIVRHALRLTTTEEAIIKHVKQHFDKVIVLLNSANIMEIPDLVAEKTADNLGVDAIMQIGHVGNDGAAAIGDILSGKVNPSGHTVDTWMSDFTKTPSYSNFGNNSQVGGSTQMYLYDGTAASNWYSIEYREDIYVGYRYYETKYEVMNEDKAGSGDEWYEETVLYPFGFGLSYTTFNWELDSSIDETGKIVAANGTVTMRINVTNTGDVAGKDVVQVYAETPYKEGGIEKASAVLMGFAKTKLLQPGESEVVELKFVAQDMASFDWDDANENGFVGYELESGEYVISARKDAHTVACSITRTIDNDITCPTDYTTGEEIVPVFSQTDGKWADYISVKDSLVENLMSRTGDMEQPTTTTMEDRTVTRADYDAINDRRDTFIYEDSGYDAWYISEVPSTWTQGAGTRTNGKPDIQLEDMAGVSFTAPTVDENGKVIVATDEGTQKWDEFLNQLTWEELQALAVNGNYGRPADDVIGKPYDADQDGPSQVGGLRGDGNQMGTYWISPVIIASTWNTELANDMGVAVGNECLFIDVSGWYAPGMNIHRSPFGGRNFEYYSEDGVLSGKIAAAVASGSTSKGVVTYIKHIALNDQETNRDSDRGLFTWATEQAIREIYLKPFELAIKEGHANGTMNCANRIGSWTGYSQTALQTGILRGEWQFKGITLTDAGAGYTDYCRPNTLWRTGTSLPLGYGEPEDTIWKDGMVYGCEEGSTDYTLASPIQWYWCRLAVLYNLYTEVNSCGMNNMLGDGKMYTLRISQGEEIEQAMFTNGGFGTTTVRDVKVISGALPAGLSISESGLLTGTPTTAGTFAVELSCIADNYLSATVRFRIIVS